MRINHKYIDYFFAVFELFILICCILNLNKVIDYRFMLGIASVELCARRLSDAIGGDEV